jgi:hypothetical protein
VAQEARPAATVAVAGVVADVVPAAALVVGTLVAAGETANPPTYLQELSS